MKQKQKQVYFGTVSFGKASRFLGKRLLITRGIYSDLNQNKQIQLAARKSKAVSSVAVWGFRTWIGSEAFKYARSAS